MTWVLAVARAWTLSSSVEPALFQRHDLAGGVGGADLGLRVRGGGGGLAAGGLVVRAGLAQGLPGVPDVAVLAHRGDGAPAADPLPGGGLAGAVLEPGGGLGLPPGDGGFLPLDPGRQLELVKFSV